MASLFSFDSLWSMTWRVMYRVEVEVVVKVRSDICGWGGKNPESVT